MNLTQIGNDSGFHWIDVVDPTPEQMGSLSKKYNLPPELVRDCLQPEHLPKYEHSSQIGFVIVRAYDERCPKQADQVRELTRKTAIFFNSGFLLTLHRKDQPFIENLRNKWNTFITQSSGLVSERLLLDLLKEAALTYQPPIDVMTETLEELELALFEVSKNSKTLKKGYYLRRRAAVFRRILRQTLDAQNRIPFQPQTDPSIVQDLKETLESLSFQAESLSENVSSFLNLHLSFAAQHTNEASHRTNEVMRVLTLFSVFFLPLNFLASIYGMNFEHMPELKSPYGYPIVLLTFATIAALILFWFRRKKWL